MIHHAPSAFPEGNSATIKCLYSCKNNSVSIKRSGDFDGFSYMTITLPEFFAKAFVSQSELSLIPNSSTAYLSHASPAYACGSARRSPRNVPIPCTSNAGGLFETFSSLRDPPTELFGCARADEAEDGERHTGRCYRDQNLIYVTTTLQEKSDYSKNASEHPLQ